MPREDSPYYNDLRKKKSIATDQEYWSHYQDRHKEALKTAADREADRLSQADLFASMRAEAINNAPIDELKAEIEEEFFEETLISDLREDLHSAIATIDELITAYLEDETEISIPRLLDIRADVESALDLHEQTNERF